ncbi:phage tail protein [Pectobacterium sp. CHL-2024]|uniref:phage tail protein n=1 Tax=Pectobacterium sp. CHL-2024 TaxID=3377079 RepID=UPI0037F75C07
MSATYFALLTNIGAAKLANATALGVRLNITQMAVGDGGGVLPTPNPAQTALISEKRRAALNMMSIDPKNPSQIIAEQVIPENEGGWWIREIGLFDDDGNLIAVANCPETYKPQLQEGSGRIQTVRMILIVSSTDAVTLKIDPAVVLATRSYVDNAVIEVKAYADNLMRLHLAAADPHPQYAPKASPALTGKPTAPTAAQASNDTQLATTAFVKAAIAALVNGSPGALDTLQELAAALGNDPNFSTTVLNAIADVTNKQNAHATAADPHPQYAPKASPALTGKPTAPTATQASNDTQLANTAFVKAAIGALINGAPGALDTLQELAAALGNDPNFSTTVLSAIADVTNKQNAHASATDPHTQYAPKVSPALTGKPTAPTATQASNDTQLATTAFVKAAISALVNGSPGALDTLQELAAALGNDPDFSTTIVNALAGKLAKDQNGADIVNKKQFARNASLPHLGSGWVNFGGSAGAWTTAQFIDFLDELGAFQHLYFVCAGSWSYAVNRKITDTGCGHIELAGAVVEVFSDRFHCRTIRITTPTTSSDAEAIPGTFVYIDNGADSAPGWRREYNSKTLHAADIAALGVPLRDDKQMCRAWVRFNENGEINDAYNVQSVIKNSTGDFTIRFKTPMKNENYAFTYTVGGRGDSMNMCSGASQLPTVDALRVISVSATGIGKGGDFRLLDFPVNSVAIFGGG